MRKGKMRTLVALLLACPAITPAFADDKLPVPADDYVYCTVCHGVQLMGNPILKAPRLSGMETWYVEQQLRGYSDGWRGKHEGDVIGMDMQPMAAALSEAQISEAAAFTNATRSAKPEVTVSGDANKGRILYSTCRACHGANAEGNEALGTPGLTVPNDWYLVTQLRNYRSGIRGSHPADIYGMQMRAAVQPLADDEAILDVVSYINTLQEN